MSDLFTEKHRHLEWEELGSRQLNIDKERKYMTVFWWTCTCFVAYFLVSFVSHHIYISFFQLSFSPQFFFLSFVLFFFHGHFKMHFDYILYHHLISTPSLFFEAFADFLFGSVHVLVCRFYLFWISTKNQTEYLVARKIHDKTMIEFRQCKKSHWQLNEEHQYPYRTQERYIYIMTMDDFVAILRNTINLAFFIKHNHNTNRMQNCLIRKL